MLLHLFFWSIKVAATIFVGGSAFLYLAQEKLIFFPAKLSDQNRKAFFQHEISIIHDDITLQGWLLKGDDPSPERRPFMIYYGGNAEEVSENLNDLEQFPSMDMLFMNYRGYGNSQGKPTRDSLCSDALYIFDYVVKELNINPENIILFGRSLGSGVATFVAANRQISSIILVTPFDSILLVAKKQYPIFPIKLLLKHNFDSLATAPLIAKPLLNIMAEQDAIIPKQHAKNLAAHWKGPTTSITIKGAAHNNVNSFPNYWQAIRQFVKGLNK